MYRNIEPLCCVPRTDVACDRSITHQKQTYKLTEEEIGFVVTRSKETGEWGNWIKTVKRYRLPVLSTSSHNWECTIQRDNITNTAIRYK